MDVSETAMIRSNYLKDIQENVNDLYDYLVKQDETIHDTINDVSDISSATPPSFSDINEYKKETIKKLKEVDEDLASFTSKGDETDVEAIMSRIEAAMNNAQTSEGQARFSDFEGASQSNDLGKLQEYNESKKEEREEEIENLSSESKDYLERAKVDYDSGNIDKATLEAITTGLINGGNEFLEKLMNNKETNQLADEEAKKVYEWGQNHRELFVDPKTLLKEQKEISQVDEKGGFETEEVWNINLELNGYMHDKETALQSNKDKEYQEANEKEKQLRNKYSDLSEYLIMEGESSQSLEKPLKLDNGEELNYRVDSKGHLHYKTEKGYEYYEETHKQSESSYVQGVVAKTAFSALVTRGTGKIVTKLPQWAQKSSPYVGGGSGLATELSGNSSWNPMYVSKPGEIKTMIYRTNKETGEVENLIIDSQGNEVIKKKKLARV